MSASNKISPSLSTKDASVLKLLVLLLVVFKGTQEEIDHFGVPFQRKPRS